MEKREKRIWPCFWNCLGPSNKGIIQFPTSLVPPTILFVLFSRYHYSFCILLKYLKTNQVVSYTTQYETEKFGLCSNYLKSKEKGDKIPIAIMKARRFRLPVFNSTPIIMAGAGSGISPYFGFVEQRLRILFFQ